MVRTTKRNFNIKEAKASPFTPVSRHWTNRSGPRTLAHWWIITCRIITLDFRLATEFLNLPNPVQAWFWTWGSGIRFSNLNLNLLAGSGSSRGWTWTWGSNLKPQLIFNTYNSESLTQFTLNSHHRDNTLPNLEVTQELTFSTYSYPSHGWLMSPTPIPRLHYKFPPAIPKPPNTHAHTHPIPSIDMPRMQQRSM